MDIETLNKIDKLKEFYAGDEKFLEYLDSLTKIDKNTEELKALQEFTLIQKFCVTTLNLIKQSSEQLLENRDLTEKERAYHQCSLTWGKMFLNAFSINPDKTDAKISSIVNGYVKRMEEHQTSTFKR